VRDVFLAVDAGNTKTWAGLTTAEGDLIGLARGGVGDIYAPAGAEAAKAVVLSLVGDVLDSAGIGPSDIKHAAFRLAGVDWPVDAQFWIAALRELFDDETFSIKNDGFALIRCGRLDGQGISVVLGTGAALAGRGPEKEWALSWWLQHPLGGAGLVSEALRAVYLSQLGLAESTKLAAVLPPLFGASTPEEMLETTTTRGNTFTFAALAAHAPSVLALVDDDPVVAELVNTQADRIADYTLSLARTCGLAGAGDPVTVVVGGGLVREPRAPLFTALRRTCDRRNLNLDLQHNQDAALVGALLDALAEGGATPTEAVRSRLTEATRTDS
jgi:N-acetylglucosamine kinase-like BadF-type ATPase